MKLLYIHGAFSAFNRGSLKVQNLEKEFEVVGFSYSMEQTFPYNRAVMTKFCVENEIDCVVGTSLGGLYAVEVGRMAGIPSVSINPCLEPYMSLSTIVGTTSNYVTGKEETLTKELVATFPKKVSPTPLSLVFVGMGDTLIDHRRTVELSANSAGVVRDYEADHYWDDFEKNKLIRDHVAKFRRK
ncbi:hypothetical protein QTV49_000470 [Vibrio vulnificus]|nr:hypothetical protein [Vibrio vulnificus]